MEELDGCGSVGDVAPVFNAYCLIGDALNHKSGVKCKNYGVHLRSYPAHQVETKLDLSIWFLFLLEIKFKNI